MTDVIDEAKFDPADLDLVATDKDKASAKMNIVMQLRKSMDVRGNLAIKFGDGKSQKVPMNIMKIALDKFSKVRKPDSKMKMQDAMGKSYKDMITTLKTFKEETQMDEGFSPKEIKMAIGVASDKRYAGVNMTGAVRAIDKIKRGLSNHPQVSAVLKRQNEELEEATVELQALDPKNSSLLRSLKRNKVNMSVVEKPKPSNGNAFIVKLTGDTKGIKSVLKTQWDGEYYDEIEEATTKQKKALTSLMTKALGGKKSKPGYTSSIASNGDFVAYDGGMRIQGRIKKGDFTNPMTESYGSMNASVDKVKVQKQIDQTEKHMKTFFGNTSSVKMKKLAMQKKLDKLKAQLKEEVLLDEALELTEAMGNWTISVVKPVNKLKKGQNVTVKARSAFEAINKAMKHWKDPALKAVPATHFKIVKEEVELELDEGKDLTYTVVHARKGKVVVTAPTSYAAAQKAAKQWKLKSTGGVDAHLMKEEALQEASAYKVLHNTFSAAVQEAIAVAKKQGYDVDEDDWSNKVATGPKKPSKDKTNRYSIKLEKSGKPARKFLQIQVYNMGSKYELNCYVQ